MLKKLSFSLLAVLLLSTVQVEAAPSLEDTLGNIDFHGLCKKEGGSEHFGESIYRPLDAMIAKINESLLEVNLLLQKEPGNLTAVALNHELTEIRKNLMSIQSQMGDNWSEGCFLSKAKSTGTESKATIK